MTKNWRGVRRSILTAMIAMLAIGVCTAAFAQTNATVTILESAHDFSTGATAPGYQVTATENHCEACHGPPAGGTGPGWNHNQSGLGDYNAADWTYAIGDATLMVASELTRKCMGCHEGDIHIDDYTGNPSGAASGPITGTEAFRIPPATHNPMVVHHPIDIVYDGATASGGAGTSLAELQGALEDPDVFLNPQGGGTIAATLLNALGELDCNSCHEQHNDRRFDLAGGDPSDDPEPDDPSFPNDSEFHNFLKFDRLCFNCHTEEQPHDGDQHHIPGRSDPDGMERGSDMNCTLCHDVFGAPDPTEHIPPCANCHNTLTPGIGTLRVPGGTPADIPDGHHGGTRTLPYFNCAACHADPLTGIVTGNDFGTVHAPSCYKCHDDEWNDGGNTAPDLLSVAQAVDHDTDPLTPDQVYGTVGEAIDFTAVVGLNTEGDELAYQWSWGDGSTPPFPSHDPEASHTFDDFAYGFGNPIPIYKASVSVTDGVNAPITYEFDVVISAQDDAPGVDTWTVTPSSGPEFDITFENHDGALVGVRSGQLAYGVEYVGVIFWMELWMDLDNENAFWGVGDMYFGNIDREGETMVGVQIKADGSIDTYTGAFIGTYGGGH